LPEILTKAEITLQAKADRKMKRRLIIIASSTLFVLAFWFLAVDLSWFVEDCPACGYGRDILQYRVFGIPIHEQSRESITLLQRVAADIGAECSHPNLERWHKYRFWGLCIPAWPCINGTYRLTGDYSWYDDEARSIVKEMGRATPSLRNEFADRVLKDHDWEYWKDFVKRLKTLQNSKTNST
jgi:hypothetical protein